MSQTTHWKGFPVTFGGLPSYRDSKEIQRIKILWTIKSPHKVHEIYSINSTTIACDHVTDSVKTTCRHN